MLGIFCDSFLNIFILSDLHQMTDDVYHCKAWVEKESLHIAGLDLWKPVRQMRLKHAVAFHNLREKILTLVHGLREWAINHNGGVTAGAAQGW